MTPDPNTVDRIKAEALREAAADIENIGNLASIVADESLKSRIHHQVQSHTDYLRGRADALDPDDAA